MTEKFYSMTELVKLTDNLIAAMPTSFYSGIMAVRGELVTAPAADVVPVVRCKDCKYRHDDDFCGGRGWPEQLVPDDGYCDTGARKDGDGDV